MVIYLESTVNLLLSKDLQGTKTLISSGEIKETEVGLKYLKIG